MSQTLINELKDENLCTHFVLPLLKLNKFSFTSSNFVNCYLTEDGSKIIVNVVDTTLVSRKAIRHKNYFSSLPTDNSTYLVYFVPVQWKSDVSLFMQGKFSMMSKHAKEVIRRFSGLNYKQKGLTDGRLLALDKHPVLKNMWENELTNVTGSQRSIVELDEDMELLSIPGKQSYINLEGLKRI